MDAISLILTLAFILNSSLGMLVFFQKGDRQNKVLFVFLTFFISIWILTNFAVSFVKDQYGAYLISGISYATALSIGYVFLYFCYFFPKRVFDLNKYLEIFFAAIYSFALIVSFSRTLTIKYVIIDPWQIQTGFGVYVVFLVFGILISVAFTLLIKKLKYFELTQIEKTQIRFVFIGTILSAVFGIIFNLLLPLLFQNYAFVRLGPVFVLIMIISLAYSIIKHRLFNIKVIATELLVATLGIALLFRTFFSESKTDLYFNSSLFLVILVVGLLLVRSVLQEVRAREETEKLAKDLQTANARLNKVSMLKTEFVSLATHQLRSPLTAIKGYVSMILEGSYGTVSDQMKEPLERVFNSTGTLTQIVQDFLDVSRIEQGSMKYDMKAFSLKDLAQEVVNEQSPNIKKAELDFSFNFKKDDESGARYLVYGDRSKLKQVVANIVDNALKYTKSGFIEVRLSYTNRTVVLEVRDSGMGIDEKTLGVLFQKFERADGADEVNVQGTGLGLYIAKQIIEAHGGTIRASSEGLDKGSTFSVELTRKEF